MAIIMEEEEEEQVVKEAKPTEITQKPSSSSSSKAGIDSSTATANAFAFWTYFTVAVSLITLLFFSLSSLIPQDDKSWFLSLSNDLRLHYSKGRTIKVHINYDQQSSTLIEVFAIEDGPRDAETVFFVHGLGSTSYSFRQVIRSLGSSGIHAVAIDLPGSGFSDKSSASASDDKGNTWGGGGGGGIFGRIWNVYSDIKEKGLFWGFDHLIETGQIPYIEETNKKIRVSTRKIFKPLKLGSEDIGQIIGQVISSMGLAPVHLVLHDSALGMGASWILENSGSVRSLTLVDSSSKSMALPLWLLEMPVIGELVLGYSFVYVRFLRFCCSRTMEVSAADDHRVLLRGRDGRRALVGVGRGMNYSFDLGEWAGSEVVKGLPIQVLWSSSWSKEWSEEGRRVADVLPVATFITHSGGRWPQEDATDEIVNLIARFVSSLPKSVRKVDEEPVPEHIQKMFGEAKGSNHHHHYHGHGDHDHRGGHGHVHAPGFMDAYGLDHGWED